ncbi:uncharacterized protein LOC132620087 [Lycium barbarum]|uniref:uncharacterized protein LOC132620087 n=1 Tax=Lycium barbarum TaxID=112863 RepID=UPI00293EC6B0|nr:uncharacterized protein LOC132620087 [Lycium barbarum]
MFFFYYKQHNDCADMYNKLAGVQLPLLLLITQNCAGMDCHLTSYINIFQITRKILQETTLETPRNQLTRNKELTCIFLDVQISTFVKSFIFKPPNVNSLTLFVYNNNGRREFSTFFVTAFWLMQFSKKKDEVFNDDRELSFTGFSDLVYPLENQLISMYLDLGACTPSLGLYFLEEVLSSSLKKAVTGDMKNLYRKTATCVRRKTLK